MASLGLHFRDFFRTKLSSINKTQDQYAKEVQSLDDQKKDLGCQTLISEYLLLVIQQEVFNLQGLINTLNVSDVIDHALKSSLEKDAIDSSLFFLFFGI